METADGQWPDRPKIDQQKLLAACKLLLELNDRPDADKAKHSLMCSSVCTQIREALGLPYPFDHKTSDERPPSPATLFVLGIYDDGEPFALPLVMTNRTRDVVALSAPMQRPGKMLAMHSPLGPLSLKFEKLAPLSDFDEVTTLKAKLGMYEELERNLVTALERLDSKVELGSPITIANAVRDMAKAVFHYRACVDAIRDAIPSGGTLDHYAGEIRDLRRQIEEAEKLQLELQLVLHDDELGKEESQPETPEQIVAAVKELRDAKRDWAREDGNTPGYNLRKARSYGARIRKYAMALENLCETLESKRARTGTLITDEEAALSVALKEARELLLSRGELTQEEAAKYVYQPPELGVVSPFDVRVEATARLLAAIEQFRREHIGRGAGPDGAALGNGRGVVGPSELRRFLFEYTRFDCIITLVDDGFIIRPPWMAQSSSRGLFYLRQRSMGGFKPTHLVVAEES